MPCFRNFIKDRGSFVVGQEISTIPIEVTDIRILRIQDLPQSYNHTSINNLHKKNHSNGNTHKTTSNQNIPKQHQSNKSIDTKSKIDPLTSKKLMEQPEDPRVEVGPKDFKKQKHQRKQHQQRKLRFETEIDKSNYEELKFRVNETSTISLGSQQDIDSIGKLKCLKEKLNSSKINQEEIKNNSDEKISKKKPKGNKIIVEQNKGTSRPSVETFKSDDFNENRKSRQNERDSGVHSGDSRSSEVDRENIDAGDDLNPPTENIGRKEGVIYTRPKLSKEKDKIIEVYQKDEKTRNLIRKAIERNDFLNNYMDKDRKDLVIDAMEPANYPKDTFIIRENDEGSEIYVSDDGIFDVLKGDEIINTLGPGTVFGELAILYNAKRFASIKAATDAKVWKIGRTKFHTIMLISGSKEREENLNFLKSVPHLNELPNDVLIKVVDLLKRVFFPTDKCIIRQGDVGNDFFIIRGGSVTVTKSNEYGENRVVGRRRRGEYFGEQAIINEDLRTASVYADAPGTECLKLDRQAFIDYLGTIPELKKKPIDLNVPIIEKRISKLRTDYDHVELNDLEKVATLGVGGFGRVELVTYLNKQSFALKILKKVDIINQHQTDHVFNEKMVMSMCHNPFLVELYKTFRDNKYVYFLMEVCLGGDVWTIMHQKQYFDEKTSKFIVACVIEAFDFLHARNIIYRDLKPENLMLTPDGYCKLVDFGFAKQLSPNYKTNTFAGTPEYVAPEIILDRGHDRAVDYWALGVLIHELLCGRTPFRGKDQMKIYRKILRGIESDRMSSRIPRQAQDIITRLCKQMPAERLGYQKKGIADIKKHRWFNHFDWIQLQKKQMESPIPRPILNNTDLQYFTPTHEEISDPPDETSGWDIDF